MVASFRFARIPNIHFKPGGIKDLPSIAKSYGNRVVLVTGKRSFLSSEFYKPLLDGFAAKGLITFHVVVSHEPSPEDIDNAVHRLNGDKPDLVMAIGGGSVIDAGKAISAMMLAEGSVQDYLESVGSRNHPGTKLPFIAVPTTAGTGSEATRNSVISRSGKGGFKKSLRHDNFVPDTALVDPLLTVNCPADITAASGMDCFTQLTEAYLSDRACEYTDALAMEGLRNVRESLMRCFLNGDDTEARSGMSFAALTSGICLANAGLGVVHGFASSLGGLYDIPHGQVCGTLMATANRITVRELRKDNPNGVALMKYARLGRLFLGDGSHDNDYYIDGFVDYLFRITSDLELPGLEKMGVKEKDFNPICESADCKNNPVQLGSDCLFEILSERFK